MFSQTQNTTVYHIKSEWIAKDRFFRDDCCINIIDTPGYADTKGMA
jgi:translation elongation factor EF-G